MLNEESVVFYLNTYKEVEDLVFDWQSPNPGCGGTQFCSIMVSLLIAKANPHLAVTINSQYRLNINNCPSNISYLYFSSIEEVLQNTKQNDLILSPINYLEKTNKDILEAHKERIIPWIHHPFSKSLLNLQINFPFAVAVGTYQYYSNIKLKSDVTKLIYIQNPFNNTPFESPKKVESKKSRIANKDINAVYLGSLIPGKGFHLIAQQWSSINKQFPNLTLKVIGSSSTYGKEPTHPLLPCNQEYGNKILEGIPKSDVEQGRVQFLGNLGSEKIDIFNDSDVALLNPTGNTEAFPASPLECMAAGLPVIASDDYGMGDSMRFFPELALSNEQPIVNSLKHLFQDSGTYNYYHLQSLLVSQWFANQTQISVLRWIELFNALFQQRDYRLSPQPLLNFYGSKSKLAWRASKVYLKKLLRK